MCEARRWPYRMSGRAKHLPNESGVTAMRIGIHNAKVTGGSLVGLTLTGLVYVGVFGSVEAWLIAQYPAMLTAPEKIYIGGAVVAIVLTIASMRPRQINKSSRCGRMTPY